ncbi:uncharacterized protein LOC109526210 isoform X2 [Hippocampus comes]|uniref:uncharacterized protein LOC109526210 isoform X2 n=1 Tax=Hippocampus comes TaxID=109280 RepID=UPI00094EFEC2|nr:PREDICTED: uncharacterized protein LOC109526210 isoform X2 [Hippocampus comes]
MPQLTFGGVGGHAGSGPGSRTSLEGVLDRASLGVCEGGEPVQKCSKKAHSSKQPSHDLQTPLTSSNTQMWRKTRWKISSCRGCCAFLPAAALWSTSSSVPSPLGLALADSLLVSILQEPLADPSALHVQGLLSTLESVSHTLDKVHPGSQSMEQDCLLTEKVTFVRSYLRKRSSSLRRLLRVQAEFEAAVKELEEGVDLRWGRLEELHTGVTLTREGDQDRADLASAHQNAETLFAVLSHHRKQLDDCQTLLKDNTQLLQELMWSHSHAGNTLRGCNSESVWPELLLQSNMERFDKVQESFLSLEQQTATFQAHLEGLARDKEAEHASGASSPDLNGGLSSEVSSEHPDSDGESDGRLSLCERSAQQLSSTFERLRKSGRKKKEVIGR